MSIHVDPRLGHVTVHEDGRALQRHFIEPGDRYVAAALPPGSDIGNTRWWHGTYCLLCAPEQYLTKLREQAKEKR